MSPSRRRQDSVAEEGFEQGAETTGETALSETGGAKSDAIGADLTRLSAELKSWLSADQCRRLAKLLTCNQESGKP